MTARGDSAQGTADPRYAAALARLYALQSRGIRMGASRMRAGLSFRGRPDRGQRFVLVGGTNGKGSVSAMIAACLSHAGYRTGLFTSPHMHRYAERVRIDGRPLSEREATLRIEDLLAAFGRRGAPDTTFFELTTLLAIEAFRDHQCDIAVLEVGLGGRLDATNAVAPLASVITRVALDHMHVLGDTVAEIAREKAGILKRGVPAVIGVRDTSALRPILARARRAGVPLSLIGRDFDAVTGRTARDFGVRVGRRVLADLRIRLAGDHQRENAACAVAALSLLRGAGLATSDADVRAGLLRVRWPGRLERIAGRPAFLFDAAHNADGCEALARHLERGAGRAARRVLVFGAMADKQYPQMLHRLAPLVDRIVYSPPNAPRAASHAQLRAVVPGAHARSAADAIARARRAAGHDGLVIVAGSIFLVAEARAHVLGLRSDPAIRM
jgi:dihydrofolate synthase / folylpolyglutamate synthase